MSTNRLKMSTTPCLILKISSSESIAPQGFQGFSFFYREASLLYPFKYIYMLIDRPPESLLSLKIDTHKFPMAYSRVPWFLSAYLERYPPPPSTSLHPWPRGGWYRPPSVHPSCGNRGWNGGRFVRAMAFCL